MAAALRFGGVPKRWDKSFSPPDAMYAYDHRGGVRQPTARRDLYQDDKKELETKTFLAQAGRSFFRGSACR